MNSDSNFFNSNNQVIEFDSYNHNVKSKSEFNTIRDAFTYQLHNGISNKISLMLDDRIDEQNKVNSKNLQYLKNITSILTEEKEKNQQLILNEDVRKILEWKPPEEFLDEKIVLFPGMPFESFKKIFENTQFSFISVLNILFDRPDLIARIFENDAPSIYGLYGVWLNCKGKWVLYLIDHYFPVYNNEYYYSDFHGNKEVFFHFLIEKALALKYKGYENINKVPTIQIIEDLTGLPYHSKVLNDFDDENIWQFIKENALNQYLIFVEGNHETWEAQGLSFLIVSSFDVNYKENEIIQTDRILKLRSPDKKFIHQGKWRKNSPFWNLIIENQISNAKDLDQVFYLSLSELKHFFFQIYVVKTVNTMKDFYTSMDIVNKKNFVINFSLNSVRSVYLSTHLNHDFSEEYSFIRTLIAKKEDNYIEFIDGSYSNKREYYIEMKDLESGNYLVAIEVIPLKENKKEDITVSCFLIGEETEFKLKLDEKLPNEDAFLDLQKKIVKSLAIKHDSISARIRDYINSDELNIKIFNDMILGFLYFYYVNKSNKILIDNITMINLQNLIICPPFKDNKNIKIVLKPDQETMLLFKYDKNGKNFSYAMSIKTTIEQADTIFSSSQIHLENSAILRSEVKTEYSDRKSLCSHSQIGIDELLNEKKVERISRNFLGKGQREKELIECLKRNGDKFQREINNKKIEVFVYKFYHGEGFVILHENLENSKYKEKILFEKLENLTVKSTNSSLSTNEVEILIGPNEHALMFFSKIDSSKKYTHRFVSQYKLNDS